MSIFHKNKKLYDLPNSPRPDFDINHPDFDDDFPKYTPSLGMFDNIKDQKRPNISQMPGLSMPKAEEEKKQPKQIFVKIEKYEEAMDYVTSIRGKIKDVEKLFDEMRNLKKEEDDTLEQWQETLNQIKEKLSMVDKNLFDQ